MAERMTMAEVRRLIVQGDYTAAEGAIQAIAAAQPLGAAQKLVQAELLLKRKEVAPALELLRELARPGAGSAREQARLGGPRRQARLVWLLRQAGELPLARTVFLERIWGSEAEPGQLERLLVLLSSGADAQPQPTLEFLERLGSGEPVRTTVLLRRALVLARLDRRGEALALFDQLPDAAQLPPHARVLHFEMLMAANRAGEAEAVARELLQKHPEEPRNAEKLVAAAVAAGKLELAAETLETALRRHPSDWWLLFRFNRVPFPPEVVGRLFAVVRDTAGERLGDARGAFQYALACLEQDDLDEAARVLHELCSAPAVSAMAQPLAAALQWLRGQRLNAPRFGEDRQADVRILPCPGADTTLIVFAGMMARFGYLPLSLADRYLSGWRAHIIYLTDPHNAGYLRGLPRFGDSEAGTVQGLAQACRELGGGRIVTLGGSIGGMAATRYATQLGADVAVSLAGPTLLDPQADLTGSPEHVRAAMSRLHRRIDLRDSLAGSATRLAYVHSGQRPAHCSHFERVHDLSNVVGRALPTDSGHTAMYLVGQGGLPALLQDELGLVRL